MRFVASIFLTWILMSNIVFADAKFSLHSPDFSNNERIPIKFTCHGADTPPTLVWENAPAGTQSFLIMVYDPNSSIGQTMYNWLVFNIPPSVTKLVSGDALPSGSVVANNSFYNANFSPPCPVDALLHEYIFEIFALDVWLNLDENASIDDVMNGIDKHVLQQAQIVGKFSH